jgi:TatD DNase family protein
MRLFDSHSHLQDAKFGDEAPAVIARAQEQDVCGIVVCGYDARSNTRAMEIAASARGVYPAVGFHPDPAAEVTPALLAELDALVGDDRAVAVGEIGLDFYWHNSPEVDQRRVLDAQLEIALRHRKPVSVHSRSAEDACLEQLAPFADQARAAGFEPGVMHCFSGTVEQARRFVEIGFLVSLACVVTYPKNDEARRIAAELPLESLLIETDSPYLPPQGRRGQRNEPAYVRAAAEAIASARSLPVAAVAEQTSRNAERLFRVGAPARAGVD